MMKDHSLALSRPFRRTFFGWTLVLSAFTALPAAVLHAQQYYLTPAGAGAMNGQDWANAYPASQLGTVLNTTMGPGATLNLGSGAYSGLQIPLTSSGTEANPKRIIGTDTGGGVPLFSRSWNRATPTGGDASIISLGAGVSHWEIANLALRNVRVAVNASASAANERTGLVFRNLDIQNVRHGFYLYNCDGTRIEDCSVTRYGKHAYRLQAGCNDVTFRNCLADLTAGDLTWWDYAEAFPFGFIVNSGSSAATANTHIRFEYCYAYNNRLNNQSGTYWNGDGFVVENNASFPNTDISFHGCVAVNNEDAGFDIKAGASFIDCVAVKNYNGFRLWHSTHTLENCLTAFSFRRNASNPQGVPSTTGDGFWIANGNATLTGVTAHNAGRAAFHESGSGSMDVKDSIASFSGSTGLFTNTGGNIDLSSAEGNVTYRPGNGVNPHYLNPDIDWDGFGADMDSATYGPSKGYNSANARPPGGVGVQVFPVADTDARFNAPDTNFGTEDNLRIKDNSSGADRCGYLRFVIPEGGAIQSATLKLKVLSIGGEGPGARTVQIRRLANDSWSETGLTWNNRPTSGDVIATIDAGTPGQAHDIDVSAYVAQETNGDGVVSFVLEQPANVNRLVVFGSRENAGNEPVLEVVREAVALLPVADVHAVLNAPDTNHGTLTELAVKDNSTTLDRSVYLRFDVTGAGAFSTATLNLKVLAIGGEGAGARTVRIRRLANDSWSEAGLTWNNRPAPGDIIATIDAGTPGQTYSIDVSAYVTQEANGDGVVSFVLDQPVNVNRLVKFGSRENAGNEPLLQLQW